MERWPNVAESDDGFRVGDHVNAALLDSEGGPAEITVLWPDGSAYVRMDVSGKVIATSTSVLARIA